MYEVKLSSKSQIVIPREIRDTLRLKADDKLLSTLRLRPSYARKTSARAKETWSIAIIGNGLD